MNFRISFVALLFVVWGSNPTYALRCFVDYQTFHIPSAMGTTSGPYVEFHFEFDGNTFQWTPASDGKFTFGAQVTVIAYKDNSIVNFFKSNSSIEPTISKKDQSYLSIERLRVPNGTIDLEIIVQDAADSTNKAILKDKITVLNLDKGPFFSQIELVAAYGITEESNAFTKNGLDIIPRLVDVYDSTSNEIAFYCELYHTNELFGKGNLMYTIELKDKLGNRIPGTKSIKSVQGSPLIPCMGRFSTDSLQAGSYTIHLELLDQHYKPLISQDRFIEMRRFMSETELLKMVDLSLTFVSKYTEEAVLMEHIKSLLPIAQNAEKNAIDYQAPSYNLKQKQGFLYYFWQKRNPSNPQLAWENYQKELAAVDKEFGTRIKKGWETDRGRVYLQYGRPSTRVVRNNNPDYWPFEIWHYYETNNHLHDRRLLFYNTALDGDFELLHSDIPGERTNFDWKNMVRSRQMNSPGVISRLKNNQARDPYSMDELEDLWYNPH